MWVVVGKQLGATCLASVFIVAVLTGSVLYCAMSFQKGESGE